MIKYNAEEISGKCAFHLSEYLSQVGLLQNNVINSILL
jgi:hypothetical protein